MLYRKKFSVVLFFCALQVSEAYGEELQENFVPVSHLGMGGASVATANDENAIWTNPAGVARVRKARSRKTVNLIRFPNVGIGANSRAKQVYQNQSGDKDKTLAETVAETGELGENKPYWVNFSVFPVALYDYSRSFPGAFGLFSTTNTKMLVEEDTPDRTRVQMVSDQGGVTNLTWTNRNNRFSAGLQVRYIQRYALEDSVPTEELKNKTAMQARFKEDANTSSAIGADLGMMFTFADFWFPTLGLAILNLPTGCQEDYLNPANKTRQTICGTKFSGEIANPDALSVVDPTDIRAGLAITPRLTRSVGLRIALDAHHIYAPSGSQNYGLPDVELQKMMHAGAELFWGNPLLPSPFALRIGSNQGFITTGFTLQIPYLVLDFATYGVDVSSTAEPIQDRRMVLSLSMVW